MKRSSLLFFALVLQLLISVSAYGNTTISAVSLSRIIDADSNGYTNFNDTVRIEAIATYTAAATSWLIPPQVDCVNLGLGPVIMVQQNAATGLYRADVKLTEWKGDLNYLAVTVEVNANANAGISNGPRPSNSILVDLAQVNGQSPAVSPLIVQNSQDITVSITDSLFQSTPLGGTLATVDLTPIGGGNNIAVPHIPATNNFSLTLDATTQTYLANREYTGPLKIFLKDPVHPRVEYTSNDFVLDTRPPTVNAAGTAVQIMSGNATALAGDVIRLTAAVTSYDNETVTVTIPGLTSGANPAGIQAGLPMTLISSSGAGSPATWILENDVILSDTNIKTGAMTVSFTFTDDTGNTTTVNRTFAIDLDTPVFNTLSANCLQPDLSNPGAPNNTVATTTCWVEIVASIPVNLTPDTLTVTADLSAIGGLAAQPMTGSLVSDYKCKFQIIPGTMEDSVQHTFVVSAKDTAGNLVVQATTPPISVDNVKPTVSNLTITSAQPTVLHGETFTITAEASLIEAGKVEVDLGALGFAPARQLLNLQSGNLYSGTFTLPQGNGGAVPYFEGRASFTVYVNDTIVSPAVPAHTITATTPVYNFYNRTLTISANVLNANNTDSPNNYATATCKLEIIANIPVSGSITPLNVSVNLTSIGGLANHPMTQVPATDNYRAVYLINPGSIEDDNPFQFVVTALDKFNAQIVQRNTSPAIAIDNNLPIITNAALTCPDTFIKAGSTFTITVNATGVENGSVSVDLTSIGSPSVNLLPLTAANTYSASFVLANSHVAGLARDALTSFPVAANDTIYDPLIPDNVIAHLVSATTNQIMLDNEPPLIQLATYTVVGTPKNAPFVIIGDEVMLEVILASTSSSPAFDGHTVTADLRDAGLSAAQPLNFVSGKFTYTFTVATGTTNLGATFPLTITDNAFNGPASGSSLAPIVASISIPLFDQNPPDPGLLALTVTRRPAEMADTGDNSTIVNTHKKLYFNLPFNREVVDDHSTATVNLHYVANSGLDYVESDLQLTAVNTYVVRMTASSTASYSLYLDVASFTSDKKDRFIYPYSFTATMYDRSGNLLVSQTDTNIKYRADCFPPSISSISASVVGGGVAHIGSQILFRVEANDIIDEYDGNNRIPPTIDLSSLGLGNAESMTNNPVGGNWYEYTAIVAAGNLNGSNASYPVTLRDGGRNFVSSHTQPLIAVDNKAPVVNSMTVTWATNPGAMRAGILATFTISLDAAETLGTATVDLSAIGGSSSQLMVRDNLLKTFTLATTTLPFTQEFSTYKFKAVVTDQNANAINVESNSVASVDCQFPTFSNAGITIMQNNGDNPMPGVSNINDVLVVYASISASLDAVASATISTGTNHIATAAMVFNSTRNRHEALFTVGADTSNWGPMNLLPIDYQLSAIDDALNIATPATGISTFTVKNIKPELAGIEMWLNPNRDVMTIGSDLCLNVASGTSVDLLLASATFKDGAQVTSAYLNLSAIQGAPAKLPMTALSGSIASTPTGINLSSYALVDDTTAEFSITLLDEAGNSDTASQTFRVDTKRPSITSAKFDGTTINLVFSEEVATPTPLMWRLVGSYTTPVNGIAKLELASETLATSAVSFFDYDFTLTSAGRKTVSSWASTPLYLEILSTNTSPINDLAGNWLPKASYYPLAITDSSFRSPAVITSLTMTHNWPASITLDFFFSKPMATSTSFVASEGVLFVDAPAAGVTDPFDQIDYRAAYCFQSSDTIGMTWNAEGTALKIILSEVGRDWIAKKLGAGSKTLKFAQRNSARPFIKDDLDKSLTYYSSSNPVTVSDNRGVTPIQALLIKGTPAPALNLASATLKLNFSDRALLFSNDYKAFDDDTLPSISGPLPTDAKAYNSFKSKIHLYNMDSGTFVTLSCKDLSAAATANFGLASTVAHLELTASDVTNILNLYTASVNPTWGIKIDAGAFTNYWGMNNSIYLPLGPGNVNVGTMTFTTTASISACAVSDMPPTREDTGNFIFEFELTAPKSAAGVSIPFATGLTPAAAIFRQDNNARLASGTFTGWSNRTVNGENRTIAAFKTAEAFQSSVQLAPAKLEVFGIRDVFDNPITGLVASYVYNRAERSTTTASGFTTASAAFVVDNMLPTVVTISPADAIGVTNAGAGQFYVDFSEAMDTATAVRPTLVLATGSTSINFAFSNWTNANTRAVYTNFQAITVTTANGTWTYTLAGGLDTAGNAHNSSSRDVQILSDAPPVAQGGITLRTVQNTINSTVILLDQPFNFAVNPTADLSITYQETPTDNLPHRVRLYSSTNTLLGSASINIGTGVLATSTLTINSFVPNPGMVGPMTVTVKIVDSAGNETGSIKEIVYDGLVPNLTSLDLAGVATKSANIYYYNNLTMADITAIAYSSATDSLRLTIASYPLLAATTTFDMTRNGSYQCNFGMIAPRNLAPGSYSIGVTDAAGNLHTGSSSLTLIVDNTKPSVTAILPATDLGNTAARMATFTIVFSERMDPTVAPTLKLATTTANQTIFMDFVGWYDTAVATTAYFVNKYAIDTLHPAGIYNYEVDTFAPARDLAANSLETFTTGSFTLNVQSKGPSASIKVLSLQPEIFGNKVLENSAYSTLVDGATVNGSATIQMTYSGTPLNTPHQLLVFSPANVHVATFPIAAGNIATFPGGFTPGSDGHYSFKLIDALGNIGPASGYLDRKLYLDRASATVTALNFNAGSNGIASGGIIYYSPAVAGSATVTLQTLATDSLRLVASGTATYTFDLASSTTSHSGLFGGSLQDGLYQVTTADFAGNFSEGATSTFMVMVDSTRPLVSIATPSGTIGAMPANGGNFQIIFAERMNTAVSPTVTLATSTVLSKEAPLKFVSWADDFTCNFVSNGAIDDTFSNGTYSYIIAGAKDYAGNTMTTTAHGSFTIGIYAKSPSFTAKLTSMQHRVSNTTIFVDQPFSYLAEPGVATLTISYTEGPYSRPHSVVLYDSTNVEVNEVLLTASGTDSIASIDAAFFNSPGLENAKLHRFRVADSFGNMSATSSLNLIYDAKGPGIGTFTLGNVSVASAKPRYYHNPAIHGNLVATVETTNATDPLKLLLTTGLATTTYQMTSALDVPTRHSYNMTSTDNSATALPDGTYLVTGVDAAGNFADGVASSVLLIIDRAPPEITNATISNGLYLTSGAVGAATFTLTFNDTLYSLATPTLSIATTSASIACRCVSFAANQAVFTTSVAVTNSLPQGEYTYRVKATDMTGNIFDGASGTIQVRSRGPVIASIKTESIQATTASGSETLTSQPFSFLVAPGISTMSVQLAASPDGNPGQVFLHYTLEGTTIASFALPLTGNAATFTWSTTQGPQPTQPTTYIMYLADANGDFSLESLPWRVDNATPTVAGLTFTGDENNVASSTIYFNPFRHPSITAKFQAPAETEAPKMRVRSQVSTDSYELTAAGTGFWSTSFTGVYSRATQAATRLPDGKYDVGMADRAGNLAASASENLYSLVIDTQNPVVSTYTMYVASQPAVWFAPSAGDLDIFAASADQLTATGVYFLEVLNVVGTRINKLALTASASSYLAIWNGRNDQGNLVADGDYTFRASDYAGNLATATAKIKVFTSEFKATGVTQISSNSAKIWFNQELKNLSVNATSIIASPALTISNVTVSDSMAISFTVAPAFIHNIATLFTVASGTNGVRSIYGSSLTGTGNQVSLTADGQGPSIVSHDFSGLTSQKEFKIIFNEPFNAGSAAVPAAYNLRNASNTIIPITQAVAQTDQKTVKLVADQNLVENQSYTITAGGITDIFGNAGTANVYTFQGRDLTPPVITVSAFSNPANENDIIVMATSNEPLKTSPTLYVKHGSASTVSTGMQARTGNQLFMAGVSLNPANGSTGTLLVRGEDASSNQGSGEGSFTIAYVAANMQAQILSADSVVRLSFAEDSLKNDATVKILQHELGREEAGNGAIMASLQSEMRAARGLKFSQVSPVELQNNTELVPVSDAYEISIAADKVEKGFSVAFSSPVEPVTGLGLFHQTGNAWKFITSDLNADKAYAARLTSSQMLAVMRDIAAPRISLDSDLDLNEPLRETRPVFAGQIDESGSGIDMNEIVAHIDGGLAQPVSIDNNGRFSFRPLTELINGNHELIIMAGDQAGNRSQTAAIRFQVSLPLQIGQIMQYPNPASRRGNIRISANSGDLNDDLVKIKIYDMAGHKVTTLNNVRAVKENFGIGSSRYLYDIAWDLRNEDGKQVANGVYLARIEVLDPTNPALKVKKTCKLAVLR